MKKPLIINILIITMSFLYITFISGNNVKAENEIDPFHIPASEIGHVYTKMFNWYMEDEGKKAVKGQSFNVFSRTLRGLALIYKDKCIETTFEIPEGGTVSLKVQGDFVNVIYSEKKSRAYWNNIFKESYNYEITEITPPEMIITVIFELDSYN